MDWNITSNIVNNDGWYKDDIEQYDEEYHDDEFTKG